MAGLVTICNPHKLNPCILKPSAKCRSRAETGPGPGAGLKPEPETNAAAIGMHPVRALLPASVPAPLPAPVPAPVPICLRPGDSSPSVSPSPSFHFI